MREFRPGPFLDALHVLYLPTSLAQALAHNIITYGPELSRNVEFYPSLSANK